MKLRSAQIIVALAASFAVVSCASTPKTTAAPAESAAAPAPIVKSEITVPAGLDAVRAAAESARQKALSVKADKASATLYSGAETAYAAAKEKEASKDTDNAITGYTSAAGLYEQAWTDAAAKRDAALQALKATEEDRKAADEAIGQAATEQAGGKQ